MHGGPFAPRGDSWRRPYDAGPAAACGIRRGGRIVKLLIADDDPQLLRRALRITLAAAGGNTRSSPRTTAPRQSQPPSTSGHLPPRSRHAAPQRNEVTQAIRGWSEAPILVVWPLGAPTSAKGRGVRRRKDDYVTKPFVEELLARIRALTRRSPQQELPSCGSATSRSTSTRSVVALSGGRSSVIRPTPTERQVTELLGPQRGQARHPADHPHPSGAPSTPATPDTSGCTSHSCARSSSLTPPLPATCSRKQVRGIFHAARRPKPSQAPRRPDHDDGRGRARAPRSDGDGGERNEGPRAHLSHSRCGESGQRSTQVARRLSRTLSARSRARRCGHSSCVAARAASNAPRTVAVSVVRTHRDQSDLLCPGSSVPRDPGSSDPCSATSPRQRRGLLPRRAGSLFLAPVSASVTSSIPPRVNPQHDARGVRIGRSRTPLRGRAAASEALGAHPRGPLPRSDTVPARAPARCGTARDPRPPGCPGR